MQNMIKSVITVKHVANRHKTCEKPLHTVRAGIR